MYSLRAASIRNLHLSWLPHDGPMAIRTWSAKKALIGVLFFALTDGRSCGVLSERKYPRFAYKLYYRHTPYCCEALSRIKLRKPMLWWGVCDPDVPCSLPVRTRKQRRLSRHENGQRARPLHRQLVGAAKSSGLGLAQPVGNSSSYSPP